MNRLAIGSVALAVCLSPLAALGQGGPPPVVVQQPPASAGQQGTVDAGAPPVAPVSLTIPAGTLITIRTTSFLSSDRNKAGDTFNAVMDQPVIVDGWVVARRGQSVIGSVTVSQRAGRVKGQSQLGMELAELTLVDGQQIPLKTQLVQYSGGTSNGRDAAGVGTTTGLGALIGAAAGGGSGAGIGAGAGAAAGLAGVLLTRGRPTEILPETVLSFRLNEPLTISTERGQLAFQPVSQADYGSDSTHSRPPQRMYYGGHPYAYPGPYLYPYYGFYPGPLFLGFDFGRGYYGRRGFRR